jgi:hypothetical protein
MVAVRSLVLVALLAACGGKSVLHTDGDSTDDDDPSASGGSSGFGGTAAPSGGAPFTGGVSSGGAFPTGGSISVGGTGTGGTISVGGSGGVSICGVGPDLVPWDSNGVIWPGTNDFGNQGAWYTADDCSSVLPGFECTTRDITISGPDGQTGWRTSENEVCVRGLAAKVELKADGTPAYAEQWGFLAGFTLNAGMPWNATEHCVDGVEFQIAGVAPAVIRVNLSTTSTQGAAHFSQVPVVAGDHVHIPFDAFKQGSWVTNPTWLDPSQLTSLEFHVFTNTASNTYFEFCISYVRWSMRPPKV